LAIVKPQFGIAVIVLILGGCAAFDPAVRECKRHLGSENYSVIEKVELKSGAIWRLLHSQFAEPGKVLLDDWDVRWPREETWGSQPKVTLVLFERKPDSLVYCEVSSCAPTIVWLKRVPSAVDGTRLYDKWQLEKTNADDQVCVTSTRGE
jgi:hypothetical protein